MELEEMQTVVLQVASPYFYGFFHNLSIRKNNIRTAPEYGRDRDRNQDR